MGRSVASQALLLLLAFGCDATSGRTGAYGGTGGGGAGHGQMAGGVGFGGAIGTGSAAGTEATGVAAADSGAAGAGAGGRSSDQGASAGGSAGAGDAGNTDGDSVDARDSATDAGTASDSPSAVVDRPTTPPDAASSDASGSAGMAGSDANMPPACILDGTAGGTGGAGGAAGGPQPCAGTIGDFDGDGYVDCAQIVPGSVSGSNESIVFYKGITANSFSTTGVTTPNAVSSEQAILTTFDLNHDGRMDIITGPPRSSFDPNAIPIPPRVYLLGGNVDGTFSRDLAAIPGTLSNFEGLPADYDGDGRVDLLLCGLSQSTSLLPSWIVLTSSANGIFGAIVTDPIISGLRGYVTPWFAGDVTMDGHTDVIELVPDTTAPTPTSVAVSVNNGDGTFKTFRVPYSSGSAGFEARDLDGDRDVDLSITFPNGAVPFYGDGLGNFTPPPPANATTFCGGGTDGGGDTDYRTAPRGDFDGDGLLDCAYLRAGNSGTNVVFQKGVGGQRYRVETVVSTTSIASPLATPSRAVDLTGDGRDDLLLWYQDQTTLQYMTVLLRGNADGTFSSPSTPPSAVSSVFVLPRGGEIGDFNGDGRKDLLVAGVVQGTFALGPICLVTFSAVASSGDLSITEGCTSAIMNANFASLEGVADVNNDGKLDAVMVVFTGDAAPPQTFQYAVAVAFGDGMGRFTLAPSVGSRGIAGTEGVRSATLVDCNGDGKIDLAVAFVSALNLKPTAILYGDGTGRFSR